MQFLRSPFCLLQVATAGLIWSATLGMGSALRASDRGEAAMARLKEKHERKWASAQHAAPHGSAKDVPVKDWPALWAPEPRPVVDLEEGKAAVSTTRFLPKDLLPTSRERATPFAPEPEVPVTDPRFRRENLECEPQDPSRMGSAATGFRVQEGDQVWVKGYRIHPGAMLQGADFRGADLTYLPMTDMGLEYAQFEAARCRGAKFHGSRLFAANTVGVSGLDLTGAVTHPFFRADPDERPGTVKFLQLPEDEKASGAIRDMVLGDQTTLLWHEDGLRAVDFMTSFGTVGSLGVDRHGKLQGEPILGLATSFHGRLWLFSDRWFGRMPLERAWGGPGEQFFGSIRPHLRGPITHCISTSGDLFIAEEGALSWARNVEGGVSICHIKGLERFLPATSMAVLHFQKALLVFCLSPKAGNALVVYRAPFQSSDGSGPEIHRIALPEGSRPHRVVAAADGSVWVTDPGNGVVYRVRFPGRMPEVVPTQLPQPWADPRGLASGPEGEVWFAEPFGDRIGRISVEGKLTQWQLKVGTGPEDIVGLRNGTVLFTCRNQRVVGSFRYEAPRKAEPAPESKAEGPSIKVEEAPEETVGPALPPARKPEAKAGGPQPDAAQEQRTPAEPEPKEAEGSASDLPALVDEAEAQVPASGAGDGKTEVKAPAPVERKRAALPPTQAGLSPVARLRDLGLSFPGIVAGHILAEHAHGRNRTRDGAFTPELSDWVKLEDLIASALQRAGGLTAKLHPDGRRRMFLSHTETVGDYFDEPSGERVMTRKFILVTRPRNPGEGPGAPNVLVTAYPVR